MKKFWMVFGMRKDGSGREQKKKHFDCGTAGIEARRLANENPGMEFLVCEACAGYTFPERPEVHVNVYDE